MTLSYKPPTGWQFCTLEELALQEKGAIRIGPFGSALKKHEYAETGIRVLGIEDVFPNSLVSTKRKFIPESKYRELGQYTVTSGDLLVTNMGTVGRTCVVPDDLEQSIISSHLIKVSLNLEFVLPSYISWMLNFCPLVVAQIKAKCHGAIMAGFNSGLLKQLRIPLPPLAEQRRIAEVLDRAEALRAKRRATLAELDSLTQSLFLDLFGNPVANIEKWKRSTVGEITDCIVPGRDKPKSFTGNIPWITTDDLKHLEFTFNSPKGLGLNTAEINEVRARVIPKGSVIMSCVGDLGIVSIAGTDMVINQQLHSFQCHECMNNVFLMHCLSFQKAFMNAKASSTTLPYMNKTVCNSIPVIAPPISLQREFARRVTAVEALKTKQRASLAELDALFATLQHRAFRGEL